LQQVGAAKVLRGGRAGVVVNAPLDNGAVDIVGAEAKGDLRDARDARESDPKCLCG
jgi:hypothetical protein